MKIAASGFVSEQGGSVASANALLLRGLLDLGHEIDFFSKSRFVDPRPSVGNRAGFRFFETDNVVADRVRSRWQHIPLISFVTRHIDCVTYNKLLAATIRSQHQKQKYDAVLWLGEYAPMRIEGTAMISFAQGPPGTDARSILKHFKTIKQLAGWSVATKWWLLAHARLSPIGLPAFANSDCFIVGSNQSKEVLKSLYQIPDQRLFTLPYPIDLTHFTHDLDIGGDCIRVLWLGRIIPRKRIDVFLSGIELCIEKGLNVKATVVGDVGFIRGYDKCFMKFKYPGHLKWIRGVSRLEVPKLISQHDVLIQPSEEENFGSSVAEAQAIGLPVIVGKTNGNADYLCKSDRVLPDYTPSCLADAVTAIASISPEEKAEFAAASRAFAASRFSLSAITSELESILRIARNIAIK